MMEEKRFIALIEELPVIVPEDTPKELKLRLIAATKSYLLQVKSMDRVYKKYRDIWEAQIDAINNASKLH